MINAINKLDFVLITNRNISELGILDVIRQAAEGGVGTVQLREKDMSTRDLHKLANEIREITNELGLSFIVNDRADIAMAVDADGLHLGWKSLDIRIARKIVGQKKLIGFSAHNVEEALMAEDEGVDYITMSPIFETSHKDYIVQPLGLEGLKKIKEQVRIPVIALGGIKASNAAQVLKSGADGIAVMSTILLSKAPMQTASRLYGIIKYIKQKPGERVQLEEVQCSY